MALFGNDRDIQMFIKVNKELLDNIIQQEVHYYKYHTPENKSNNIDNLYGEGSAQKSYYRPVRVSCLIDTGDVTMTSEEIIGLDLTQALVFSFLRPKLEELGLVPDVGDIIEVRDKYYEVDNVNEVQYIMGKDKDHPKGPGSDFGRNFSIICQTHLTRLSRLQIVKSRV